MARRPPDDRRAAITAGLMRAMAQAGYAKATVAAIAREADLTPGLIHYHFPHKEAILLALVAQLEAQVAARVAAADVAVADVAPPAGAWDRVDALLTGLLALGPGADAQAAACWAQIGAEAQRQPAVGALYAAALGRWRASLADRLRAAGAPDPEGLALTALLACEGAWRVSHGAPGLLPPGAALPHVRALVRRLGGAP